MDKGLQLDMCRDEQERRLFGEQLKSSIADFTIDFIPHMDEEEEVRKVKVQGSKGEGVSEVKVHGILCLCRCTCHYSWNTSVKLSYVT